MRTTLSAIAICATVYVLHAGAPVADLDPGAVALASVSHADAEHLGSNLLVLGVGGAMAERGVGSWRLALFLALAGPAALAAHVLAGLGPVMGASGAAAASASLAAFQSGSKLAWALLAAVFAGTVADIASGTQGVSVVAHTAGIVFGALVGLIWQSEA